MTIRRAEAKDIDGIMELLRQSLNVHAVIRPDMFTIAKPKYTAEDLKRMIRSRINPIYVAVDDGGRIIGYVLCEARYMEWSDDDRMAFFIDDLCVDESVRGQHIGSELFEFVKAEAKRRNYHEIPLEVYVGNNDAMKFYLGMGLKPRRTIMEYKL